MPEIIIKEEDLTRGGGVATDFNVVYIPGFMTSTASHFEKSEDAATAFTPTLCTSVEEFERYFGKKPATITYNDGVEDVDKSYIYAKELLNLGLSVLYESVNDLTTPDVIFHESTIKSNASNLYAKLTDKGEYQFKFITSGGYPSYSITDSSNAGEEEAAKATVSITSIDAFPNVSSINNGSSSKFVFTYVNQNLWKQFKVTIEKDDKQNDVEKHTYLDDIEADDAQSTEGKVYVLTNTVVDEDNNIVKKPFIQVSPANYGFKVGDKITLTVVKDAEGELTYKDLSITTYKENVSGSDFSNHLVTLAGNRGDCIALIDHDNDTDLDANKLLNGITIKYDYCAMFTPWINITPVAYDYDKEKLSMPASFGYLSAFAASVKNNPSWLAIAGATRGQIPNLYSKKPLALTKTLSNSTAEALQRRDGVSINAITDIKPFGHRIWGNRTLKDNALEKELTATSFLNTKGMICDIKKVVYDACRKYTFEQNNDVLWINFKAYIEPTLNQMKTGAGLSGYKIIKENTTKKAKLEAKIKLYPIYAVEDFEITVQMLDNEIAVS